MIYMSVLLLLCAVVMKSMVLNFNHLITGGLDMPLLISHISPTPALSTPVARMPFMNSVLPPGLAWTVTVHALLTSM